MSKARLVITAVVTENRPVSEVTREYGVARSWVYALVARYRAEGEAAFEPRSRRPESSPRAISGETPDLIVRLRKELSGQGLDAGPDTICWHLEHHHHVTVSAATVSRYLSARGLVGVVGEVGLPAFVRLLGLEPDVGRSRPLAGLRDLGPG